MTAKTFSRALLYAVLLVAALFFLAPLYVMLATSFKDAAQIRNGNLLSLPDSLNFEAWGLAWSSACTGVDCRGLQPYFWNSVTMAVPAVLLSTTWGALNGYVLSLWKFRGSELLFGFLLFGVFMPFQVVLLPMSQVLGYLGLSSSIAGLVLVHCLAGMAGTTLFFRNYYTAIPKELVNAARMDARTTGSRGASCACPNSTASTWSGRCTPARCANWSRGGASGPIAARPPRPATGGSG